MAVYQATRDTGGFDVERGTLTRDELLAEIERLHTFIYGMAERIAGASEVLGRVAERRKSSVCEVCKQNVLGVGKQDVSRASAG